MATPPPYLPVYGEEKDLESRGKFQSWFDKKFSKFTDDGIYHSLPPTHLKNPMLIISLKSFTHSTAFTVNE